MKTEDAQQVQRKVQVWVYGFEFDSESSSEAEPRLKVLLLKTNAARGGFWQPVTGGVESGEDLSEAALREVFEETGIQLLNAPMPVGEPFEFQGNWGWVQEHGFAGCVNSSGGPLPQPKLDGVEHSEACWLSVEEAFSRVRFPSNAKILEELLKLLQAQSERQKK